MGRKTDVRKRGIGPGHCLLLLLIFGAVDDAKNPSTAGVLNSDFKMWSVTPMVTLADQPYFKVENLQAVPGEDAPFQIVVPSVDELAKLDSAEGTFILIRDVPSSLRVSAGMQIGKIWIVPLSQAGALRLISAPGAEGDFTFRFYLMGAGNRVLAEHAAAISLRAPQALETVGTAPAQIGAPGLSDRPQAAPPLPPEEEDILLKRGEEVLQQGGIAAARLIFEELATRGSGRAALALARTYDPAFMSTSPTSGLAPNTDKALQWYERAAALGIAEAQRRRAELGGGS